MNSDDLSPLKPEMLVTALSQRHVVCHQYQSCLTGTAEREQKFSHLIRRCVVQVSCGFIGEKDLRLDGKGPGNGDTLLFAP